MSTSANVTYYYILKDGKQVARYSRHAYCKDNLKEKLVLHVPPEDFQIYSNWPDEDENDNYSNQVKLSDYLKDPKILYKDLE